MITVVDTNVLVSATLNPFGKPAAIIKLILGGRLQIAYDTRMMMEYREVLNRPIFQFSKEKQITPLLTYIENAGNFVTSFPLHSALPDPDDQMFLEVAHTAKAEAIITGNKKHFPP
ncbi:MAG: putative toxin-antitoxin system toxin component, PIN family, partial [bacterium]